MIDIHHSDSGGTNNMNFSSITHMSIPIPGLPEAPSVSLQRNKRQSAGFNSLDQSGWVGF